MKVEIIIEEGEKFTSVDYMGNTYGGASPCKSKEDIKQAIEGAKRTIISNGDKPVIVDKREIAKLNNWLR